MIKEAARESAGHSLEEKMRYLNLIQQRKAQAIQTSAMDAAKAAAAASCGVALDEEMFQGCMALYSNAPQLQRLVHAHQERLGNLRHILTG